MLGSGVLHVSRVLRSGILCVSLFLGSGVLHVSIVLGSGILCVGLFLGSGVIGEKLGGDVVSRRHVGDVTDVELGAMLLTWNLGATSSFRFSSFQGRIHPPWRCRRCWR